MTAPDWSCDVAAAIDHLATLTPMELNQVRAWLHRQADPPEKVRALAERAALVGMKRAGFELGMSVGAVSMRLRRAGVGLRAMRREMNEQPTRRTA